MDTAIDILLFVLLMAGCAAGMFLTVLQLPGTWLIVLATTLYAWHYHWDRVSVQTLIILLVIAGVAEIIEALSGFVAAKKGGASRRAAWYGLGGGLLGAILLSIPVPVIGTIIGAAIGCFVAAFIAEVSQSRGLSIGTRSGLYTAAGRTIGTVMKAAAAVVVSIVVFIAAIA